MFTLESPHRGDSNEYTQYTFLIITKEFTLNYSQSGAMEFFKGTQERVRISRGKRDNRVRATEGLNINLDHYLFQIFGFRY